MFLYITVTDTVGSTEWENYRSTPPGDSSAPLLLFAKHLKKQEENKEEGKQTKSNNINVEGAKMVAVFPFAVCKHNNDANNWEKIRLDVLYSSPKGEIQKKMTCTCTSFSWLQTCEWGPNKT